MIYIGCSILTCDYIKEKAFKIVGVEDSKISRVLLQNIVVHETIQDYEIKHAEDIIFDQVKVNGEIIQFKSKD